MEISRTSQGGQNTFDTNSANDNNTAINTSNDASSVNTIGVRIDQNKSTGKPINEQDLKKAVERLNKFVEGDNITVQYDIHPQFKDIMVKIIDKSTGAVITEVPPKKILDMVAKMCELAGMIFDKKA
jgi:flagellar protein FlaG